MKTKRAGGRLTIPHSAFRTPHSPRWPSDNTTSPRSTWAGGGPFRIPHSALRILRDGLLTIPLHRVRHGRAQSVQILRRTPSDVMMFPGGQGHGALLWPGPVDEADVFVRVVDAMDVEEARGDEGARAWFGRGGTLPDQFHVQPALLARLAQRGLFRVFVQLDVPAQRQPLVELAMMNEQHLAVANNKDGDSEIDFFVDVSHEAESVDGD